MQLSSDCRPPALGLPGNHDFPPEGDSWGYVEAQWGLEAGQGCTLDTPYARLVLLNAQGHSAAQIDAAKPEDPVYGWVNDAELARLDQALATADGTSGPALYASASSPLDWRSSLAGLLPGAQCA